MDKQELWLKCVAFHGHECGGLTIGFKAALYAVKLLGLTFSHDEQVVCIAENDACGVDAIQVVLGCSLGKGNMLFHMTGKQAFSFYNRTTGQSVRLLLKPRPEHVTREESFRYYQACPVEEMFTAMPVRLQVPEPAKRFDSYVCQRCGELTAANWIRIQDGQKVCLDCYHKYNRFEV